MAIYYCHECCTHVDDDHHPGTEGQDQELICPDCCTRIEDEANDQPWSQTVKGATLKRTPPSEDR
jgi:hypothetical protein